MIERIVTIHDFCDPKGGATLLAVEAAAGFARAGYRSTFLAGDAGINPALAAAGVEILGLGERAAREGSPARSVLKALYNGKAARFVGMWIAANDTPGTVYHLHNWGQILSPAIFRALDRVRERLVLSAHDFFHVCPNGSFSFLRTGEPCGLVPMTAACVTANCDRRNYGFKLWRVARQAIRNALFDTAAPVPLLAIHERMRPFFVRSGVPDRWVRTLPNPVRPFTRARIRAEENGELLFIGRLETTKGPDLAAAAARRAGVTMRFVGTGALAPSLQADYPEMIFDGFVPREEIARRLAGARALVVPSRYPEPYGLVVVEALWSGLPVIIANTAFLANDVVAGGAGIAQAPQDEEGLARAIRRLFDDDALTRAMSLAAHERTGTLGLAPDAWIAALLALYAERLAPAGSSPPP